MNTTEDSVREVGTLNHARALHACQLLDGAVLVTGGSSNIIEPESNILQDEIFDISTEESKELSNSLARYEHRLILLGNTTFALGGKGAEGSEVSTVESFDIITNSWKPHSHSLESKDTASLAVTAFPRSAVDCTPSCRCGVRRKSRIVDGQEVKQILNYNFIITNQTKSHSYPWIGALLLRKYVVFILSHPLFLLLRSTCEQLGRQQAPWCILTCNCPMFDKGGTFV